MRLRFQSINIGYSPGQSCALDARLLEKMIQVAGGVCRTERRRNVSCLGVRPQENVCIAEKS